MKKVIVSLKKQDRMANQCVGGMYYIVCPSCKQATVAVQDTHETECLHCHEQIAIEYTL